MREVIYRLSWRKIVMVSILLGTVFGSVSVRAWDDEPSPAGWKCPDGAVPDCTATGCIKTGGPNGFWVCRYSGESCPPLEACNPS